MPLPWKRLITRLFTVLEPPVMLRPAPVTAAPLSSMSGAPAKPGWVVPSIVSGCVIVGRTLRSVIDCAPVPIANVMVSAATVSSASAIAFRREPFPLSRLFVT
jgi:hypothetical protein